MSRHSNFGSLRIALLLTAMTILAGAVSLQAIESKLLTKEELKTLVAHAKTARDHERLAAHFTARAEELEMEAQEHTVLAAEYRANPNITMSLATVGHCENFAVQVGAAAKSARQMAADHAKMAKEAK